ncbi:hypothetical protein CRUP_016660, partial [Coryphaenoides rupestris]
MQHELPPMYSDQGKGTRSNEPSAVPVVVETYYLTASSTTTPGQHSVLNRAEEDEDKATPMEPELPPMYSDQGKGTRSNEPSAVPVVVETYYLTASSTTTPGQHSVLNRAEEDEDKATPMEPASSTTEEDEHKATPMEPGRTSASSATTTVQHNMSNSAEEKHQTIPIERERSNDTIIKTDTVSKPINITDSSLHRLPQNNDKSRETRKQSFERTESMIKAVTCFENVTQMQSTFGAWITDAAHLDENRYWLLEHFSGRVIVEFPNISSVHSAKATDLQKFYQGCGHVVYNGSLFFHNAGTNKLLKYNLETGRTSIVVIEDTRFRHRSYLFLNSKTYFKF